MKTTNPIALLAALLLGASQSHAAITIPGADGSDGALNITADTVIDLSQAVTGAWDANNTANAGKGIYDAAKWAVVFKYSSVTVATGKTLTFKNHASRAPVVWLVSGNVSIAGTVNLDGANGGTSPAGIIDAFDSDAPKSPVVRIYARPNRARYTGTRQRIRDKPNAPAATPAALVVRCCSIAPIRTHRTSNCEGVRARDEDGSASSLTGGICRPV